MTTIDSMNIGDKIVCNYSANAGAFGTFSQLGTATSSLIPVAGTATPNGTFNFIMVGYDGRGRKKLIADRVIQINISWDTLNIVGISSGSGLPLTIDGKAGYTMRLLSGGTTSSDLDNEWDQIIVKSNLNNTIIVGDDNVWHWNGLSTLCSTSYGGNITKKVVRGNAASSSFSNLDNTNVTESYVGFRPVLLVESMSTTKKYLFMKEDYSVYQYNGGAMQKVSDDWRNVSSADKQIFFQNSGTNFPTVSALESLGKYKILWFSSDGNETSPTCSIQAVPCDRLILPKALISLGTIIHFDSAALTGILSGQGAMHVLLTTDLQTYQTYDGSQFVNCVKVSVDGSTKQKWVSGAWVDTDYAGIAAAVKANGITPAALATIPTAAWDGVILGKTGYNFAYLPTIEALNDVCTNDKLTVTLLKNGKYRKAVHSTEYDVEYDSQDHVTLKQSGDWEILYIN